MGLGKAKLTLTKLPQQDWTLPALPTWIVMGRSNVGKSSLLNALIHPQEIFRSGSTPGVTRGLVGAEVEMGRKSFFILDLPGWGYSVRKGQEQESWEELGQRLLASYHPEQTQFIWLIDPRRKMDQSEINILGWLGQLNWFLVFTKSDQVKRGERRKVENEWGLAIQHSTQPALWANIKDGEGMDELAKRARGFVRQIAERE